MLFVSIALPSLSIFISFISTFSLYPLYTNPSPLLFIFTPDIPISPNSLTSIPISPFISLAIMFASPHSTFIPISLLFIKLLFISIISTPLLFIPLSLSISLSIIFTFPPPSISIPLSTFTSVSYTSNIPSSSTLNSFPSISLSLITALLFPPTLTLPTLLPSISISPTPNPSISPSISLPDICVQLSSTKSICTLSKILFSSFKFELSNVNFL